MKGNVLSKTEKNSLEKILVKNNSSERFQAILGLVFSFKNEPVVDTGLAQKYQTSANSIIISDTKCFWQSSEWIGILNQPKSVKSFTCADFDNHRFLCFNLLKTLVHCMHHYFYLINSCSKLVEFVFCLSCSPGMSSAIFMD